MLTTNPSDANYQYAAGEALSQGIEVDLQSQLTDQLHLMANYAYTDAQIHKDTTIAKGTPLNNIPRHSGNLALDYVLYNRL